jgi:MoxR-like ATPase
VPDLNAEVLATAAKLREVGDRLEARFLDKGELIRLMLVTLLAGEHMLLIGPPGTAKSALVRELARLVDARTFEYLLTRFSEPSELFGPVDIKAYREGVYSRRTETMLPEAEIVFLDEIFKSNSAILNSLLGVLNERRYFTGSRVMRVPLCSLFGASNDVPNDEALAALFDRFAVRAVSSNLESFHFLGLLERGLRLEADGSSRTDVRPSVTISDLRSVHAGLLATVRFTDDFLTRYKGLAFQIRAEGVTVSDRRAVKLLKLFAASALLDGRIEPNDGDFFVLKHVWNSQDQAPLLRDLLTPILDRFHREHPLARPLGVAGADLGTLLAELGRIRGLLLGGQGLSDVQVFAQLRALQEIRAALASLGVPTAQEMLGEVDKLLEGILDASGWSP